MTLGCVCSLLLDWLARPQPDRGVHFARERDAWETWSYEQLAALTHQAAGGLVAAGVRERDVVAIVEGSTPQFVAALFGAILAGATPAPIAPPVLFEDPARYAANLTAVLHQTRPAIALWGAGLGVAVEPVARAARVPLRGGIEGLLASADREPRRRRRAAVALIQFTSGTSGQARGVRVPVAALEASVAGIRRWLAIDRSEATASWLPVHHDMGLVGCVLTPITTGTELWLMPPEEFLHRPVRFLACFGRGDARLAAMPCFGLAHIVRRVPPAALEGMDLRSWRALIVGAERLSPSTLERFAELLAAAGFGRRALLPAYGLAEATLAVSGRARSAGWRAVGVDPDTLGVGRRVRLRPGPGTHRVVGCGLPLEHVEVSVQDEAGERLPELVAGEIVVSGPAVADGYVADGAGPSATAFADGAVRTGDGGFLLGGELFVIGRLGDGLKVSGRFVFAEELEAALVAAGVAGHRVAAVLGDRGGEATAVAVLERPDAGWAAAAASILRRRLAPARIVVVDAPTGTIPRTSSGKPRRRGMWAAFLAGRLPGTVLVDRPAPSEQRGAHV